jgi:hypothetical protein
MLRIDVNLRQKNCCFEQAGVKQLPVPYLINIVLDRGVKKSTNRLSVVGMAKISNPGAVATHFKFKIEKRTYPV